MIAVSRLLKSWAMPPASRPIASIFWAWRSCASSRRRSVTSRKLQTRPTLSPPRAAAASSAQSGRRGRRGCRSSRHRGPRRAPPPSRRRPRDRPAARARPRSPVVVAGLHHLVRDAPHPEAAVRADDRAGAVDDEDPVGGRVERRRRSETEFSSLRSSRSVCLRLLLSTCRLHERGAAAVPPVLPSRAVSCSRDVMTRRTTG